MRAIIFVIVLLAVILGASARKISARIIGGSDAPDGAYPYQVSLRIRGFHFCAGSIINKRYILTAAHCILRNRPESIKVVVGTNLLNGKNEKQYQVDFLKPHPKYKPGKFINDIGIIRVSAEIIFNKKVQPICLPDNDINQDGFPVKFSGWGRTRSGGNPSNHLQHINLTLTSQDKCKRTHNSITESHICTFTKKGEGFCHGDSGGPLTDNGVQIGIASFGRPCALGYPDVFTRVFTFRDFINQTIQGQN